MMILVGIVGYLLIGYCVARFLVRYTSMPRGLGVWAWFCWPVALVFAAFIRGIDACMWVGDQLEKLL